MPRQMKFKSALSGMLLWVFVLPMVLAASFVAWSTFALSPLQRQYFGTYSLVETAGGMPGGLNRTAWVWWIQKTGPKRKPELAHNTDVVSATKPSGLQLPLTLSPEAQADGWTGLVSVKQKKRISEFGPVLQAQIYDGQSFARVVLMPLNVGGGLFLTFIGLRRISKKRNQHEERHGRRTKGPELASALQSTLSGSQGGICLKLQAKGSLLPSSFRIPRKLEASHIMLMGDTGSGKSNAIRQILRQVEDRGETAIVYDPAGEFVQEFYRPERQDLVLNPLDARCPFWNLQSELGGRGIEDAIAAAMLPDKPYGSAFFTDAPRRVLSGLLRTGGSVGTLLEWMSDPAKIERKLAGTPTATFLDRKAGPQRAGILSSMNMIADSLVLLPTGSEAKEWFSTGDWKYKRTRWVFLTSRPSVRERILPLHSAWLDLFILRMMEPCVNPAKPVWFVLDELASLNKLPQLHTAVTEIRKYGNPVVLGFQGRSQLEKRYGQDAEAMLSQPATKIFFKTSEPRAAKWISETLGEIEVERLKESRSTQLIGSKKNYAMEIATKPLVMASEIAGLEPLCGFIKQGNRVTPVRFRFSSKRSLHADFIERQFEVQEPQPRSASLPAVKVQQATVQSSDPTVDTGSALPAPVESIAVEAPEPTLSIEPTTAEQPKPSAQSKFRPRLGISPGTPEWDETHWIDS